MALDHATAYWERMEHAERDAKRAHERADSALHTRDQALGWLRSIRDDHSMGLEKCSCGRIECRTGDLLTTQRVERLIQATERRRAG